MQMKMEKVCFIEKQDPQLTGDGGVIKYVFVFSLRNKSKESRKPEFKPKHTNEDPNEQNHGTEAVAHQKQGDTAG